MATPDLNSSTSSISPSCDDILISLRSQLNLSPFSIDYDIQFKGNMSIVALEDPAVRAIGSTSALPDSSSVVKELLDNALDAGATSIFIEISLNTLDIIQVKDNGSGILPSDRSLACKQNYTSKIQTKEDLKNVGGRSLGFRGQALASIAEMSDAMYITTRVPEEQVARTVKFGRDGEPIR
ncbi:uncharacterized protein ARB_05891 [Trichophyton benhamiae CBS 112371]|uniref:Uncharacterized protein n=1 Tax=Arthroderma benhamiae (strain ATCC MYA-4681 / CBS 112371) TaxID=663331 RepID=D4ANS4_ARTBC|nr:uncharacterized protein ARB_05891 [Trichophyton benhamiae CBS 112371]EFE34935.1 hypothetical protein ARB_05891 [Trichophyton benhamiae CBS 112371]